MKRAHPLEADAPLLGMLVREIERTCGAERAHRFLHWLVATAESMHRGKRPLK